MQFFVQDVMHSLRGDAYGLSNLTHLHSTIFHNHTMDFFHDIQCNLNRSSGARFVFSAGSATFKFVYPKINSLQCRSRVPMNLTRLWSALLSTSLNKSVLLLHGIRFFPFLRKLLNHSLQMTTKRELCVLSGWNLAWRGSKSGSFEMSRHQMDCSAISWKFIKLIKRPSYT